MNNLPLLQQPTQHSPQLKTDKGEFIRKESLFRDWIKSDGEFKPEKDRYHIYVSYACHWAHRTLLVRKFKGLEDVISFSTVDYLLGPSGWSFSAENPDPNNPSFKFLRQLYTLSDPNYSGRVTVPILFDKQTKRIINNESSEIIRILNFEFNAFAKKNLDLYPERLREKIDELNSWIYPNINNGVYRCGFARSQEAYNRAFNDVFTALDRVEAILSKSRFLTGPELTEADVRLWTSILRFDVVYFGHFKANKKRIVDYPNLYGFLRDIYQMEGVKETVNMFHIKHHYYESHESMNPTRIVPVGPELFLDDPPNRHLCFPPPSL